VRAVHKVNQGAVLPDFIKLYSQISHNKSSQNWQKPLAKNSQV